MQISKRDIGYTVYSRVEEALREWVSDKLLLFGEQWRTHIPDGIWAKAEDKNSLLIRDEINEPLDLLEETDIPDIAEIVCYRNNFSTFIHGDEHTPQRFRERIGTLYKLRCQIAHVRQSFSSIDLDLLLEIAKQFAVLLGPYGDELRETLDCLRTKPAEVIIHIPSDFLLDGDLPNPYLHNLPPSDYDPDGGFIGRKRDLKRIRSLVLSDLDRVITISGAGGVGKTALAHKFCVSLLQSSSMPFDAIVWISAKEEKLTLTGIEPIEPSVRNYEEVLDSILEVYGWFDSLGGDLPSKENDVNVILQASDKGILLVVDNLETIQDERIIEFIKNIPRPNKVLITSRMGLGEVERRYPLKEMSKSDAVALLRAVAREKGADSLMKLSDNVLYTYVQKMSSYPLAIKWVVGQVALGKDIDRLVADLASTAGDIARFCFDHIYDNLLPENAKMVLHCLAASDAIMSRGTLTHVSGLSTGDLDDALRHLTLASLVVPEQEKSDDGTVITKYSLMPLTLGYLKSRLQSHPDIWRTIRGRMEMISSRMEEASRAGRSYRYALQDLGATTDDEKIAATWALTAYHKHQMGDYDGAIEAFNRAVDIAPNFSRLYRNWAVVESSEGYYERANELMSKATNLSPDDPTLWFVWGNIAKRRGHLDKARRYFTKALSLSPDDGAVLGGLGEVEKRSGNFEKADMYFQKALRVPQNARSYRHKIITFTAIADNLRRWAESLVKIGQTALAMKKMQTSYKYAKHAAEMSKSDMRAQDTLREVALDYARLLLKSKGVVNALPYFQEAISESAKRVKERKITSIACYYLSRAFLVEGEREQAKKYYRLGEGIRLRRERYRSMYDSLREEIFADRFTGVLMKVYQDRGYGFIRMDEEPSQTIFVHITQMFPRISNDEFKNMEGSRVSFSIKKTEKGPQANRVKLIND